MSNLSKSIEEIENDFWGNVPDNATSIVRSTYELRKKMLSMLDLDDMRLLIGQSIGLEVLIPHSLDFIADNPFVEALYFEGDLFKNIVFTDRTYWEKNPEIKLRLLNLFDKHKNQFDDIDMEDDLKDQVLKKINSLREL